MVIVIMNGLLQIVKFHRNTISRCISVFPSSYNQNGKPSEKFVPVYKFPYIVPFSLFNRLKVYQTALTVVSIPISIVLFQTGYISSGAVEYTASLGLSGCLTLYSLGFLTQNFIGFIYYCEEKDTVKISYLDFWGVRKDIEIPAKDIVPIDESPSTAFSGFYHKVRRFSSAETLRLSLRLGIILDKDRIRRIL